MPKPRPRSIAPAQRTLAAAFARTRQASEDLARPLTPEDCMVQSMPDVSPTKWHLAHTTWFFETFVLERFAPGYASFDPSYRYLFNSYYDAVGERHPRPERGLLSRPPLDEVLAYRAKVTSDVEELLSSGTAAEADDLVELGIHHEQQHQELILTDVKHVFSRNPLRPAYVPRAAASGAGAPPLSWTAFPGGVQTIGHPGEGFHFDNEAPRHRVFLQPFELASRAVTCAEYLEFIADGGYDRSELWLSDGWDTVQRNRWDAPFYWERRDGEWWAHTLSGTRRVEPGEPVCHVSYYEADAFARWTGARLPFEAEWEVACASVSLDGNFVDSGAFHPRAAEGAGLQQMFGDVWEWTASAYSPYPGFRPRPGAVGEYNGKFMVNQLVLRGGSCATPAAHIRRTYRNFFPAEARWQFSGVRLARDV